MRQTYKKGPFERENLPQDGDPPVSHPAKGGGQRRQSGAGRTLTATSPGLSWWEILPYHSKGGAQCFHIRRW